MTESELSREDYRDQEVNETLSKFHMPYMQTFSCSCCGVVYDPHFMARTNVVNLMFGIRHDYSDNDSNFTEDGFVDDPHWDSMWLYNSNTGWRGIDERLWLKEGQVVMSKKDDALTTPRFI